MCFAGGGLQTITIMLFHEMVYKYLMCRQSTNLFMLMEGEKSNGNEDIN